MQPNHRKKAAIAPANFVLCLERNSAGRLTVLVMDEPAVPDQRPARGELLPVPGAARAMGRRIVTILPMNSSDPFLEQAVALHNRVFVIDTHCDTTQRLLDPAWDPARRDRWGHVDIPRMREGGVDAMFFAVWAPPPDTPGDGIAEADRQLQRIHETLERNRKDLTLAHSAEEIQCARRDGRMAVLITIEGGHLIEDSLEILRAYHGKGAMCLTLTHAMHTNWADSSGVDGVLEPLHGGLTSFGHDVVRLLNELGMIVDVSHVSDATVEDVLETSSAPVVATHSSCRAVSPHCRNLSDELMQAIAETGGLVQINFCAAFIDPDFPKPLPHISAEALRSGKHQANAGHDTPLSILVDHFDHALQVIGPAHVGIGSDFDGVPFLPTGMEDCSKLPFLTAELLRRGWSEDDLTQMLGTNVLRVLESCARIAKGDKRATPAPADGSRPPGNA